MDRRSVGKRVGGALYLHRTALPDSGEDIQRRVAEAEFLSSETDWNVVKILGKAVSLLKYEDFDSSAFPALLFSTSINLSTQKVLRTDYSNRENPPILHRKETLLAAGDSRKPAFSAVTALAEKEGLFAELNKIGTRKVWNALLEKAGLEVRGPNLVRQGTHSASVARHKTALLRRDLSQPIQLLLANKVVSKECSVFDYGCGKGDDVAILNTNGYQAFGWDPFHAKEGRREPASIVNLGFVLNVVEDPYERIEVLKSAWTFAERALSVAVMTLSQANLAGLKPYRDGYLTSRGTFQKYFGQQELRNLIEEVLGEAPVSIGPGIYVVFRDKELEQEVLLRRRSRAVARQFGLVIPQRSFTASATPEPFIDRVAPELESLWSEMIVLGRPLDIEELSPELLDRLRAKRLSLAKATTMCLSNLFDQTVLSNVAAERRSDYLVHFALTLFPGAPRYTTLPKSIQRDVRAFFGAHVSALALARQLLFSVGKNETINEAVDVALREGIGGMRDDNTFRFSAGSLNRLPEGLRVLVGCAALLGSGVDAADFVDIKLNEPRVIFITCIDQAARLPLIVERNRVDLKSLKSRVERPEGLVLYLKGHFLAANDPSREEQIAFDKKLLASGLISADGRGPRLDELKTALQARRNKVA